MKISREDLRWAAEQDLLRPDRVDALWDALDARQADRPRFDASHVAYYAGALIVLAAMTWLMGRAWERFGGLGLLGLALAYAAIFVLMGNRLWSRRGYRIPSALLYVLAVGMTPLATYGFLRHFGLWIQEDPLYFERTFSAFRGSGLTLDLATILTGLITLQLRRLPMLTVPVAVALWSFCIHLAPLLAGTDDRFVITDLREWLSFWFGLGLLGLAYGVDLRERRQDFAGWFYFLGLAAFWAGLVARLGFETEGDWLVLALVGLGAIVLALFLRRGWFLVLGGASVMSYLTHLAYEVFRDSLLFPFALTVLGLSLIVLGVIYQRNRRELEAVISRRIPAGCRRLLPPRARDS